ncbi:uncharacterized protein DEA37_0003638 [Paragonimus westermani]|uniref:Uncharacterized protein n=1 Tax=Paragonimus westermani TaxID=34504 RepID=A0A5J4NR43_9TREM|nr:uncharacterized protein DEA37_0003638 [Paragonimus westermani]
MWIRSRSIFTWLIRIPSAHSSKRATQKKLVRDTTVYDLSSDYGWKGNQAYVFGFSASGALGIKHLVVPKDRFSLPIWGLYHPVRLSQLDNPISVACGYGFTAYICKHGRRKYLVFGCGINSDGQLGQHLGLFGQLSTGQPVHVIPSPELIHLPLRQDEAEHVYPAHIACGRAHTIIGMRPHESDYQLPVHARPFLFTLGNNAFGQCGRQRVEQEVYGPKSAVITRVHLPPDVNDLKQVCCGQDHSLLLSTDGHVFSAGLGSDGQTGLGHLDLVDQFSRVRGSLQGVQVDSLASAGDTVLAVSTCGRLFGWGNNEYGQLWSIGETIQLPEPTELPLDECVVPKEAGSQYSHVRIGRIKSIACAGSMCCLLNESGYVFVWGFGCLGLGPELTFAPRPTLIPPGLFAPAMPDTEQRLVSIVSGLHHFVARNADGLLWAWGAPRGGLYCLGLGNQADKTAQRQTFPFPLHIPACVHLVACGVDHTVALAKSLS